MQEPLVTAFLTFLYWVVVFSVAGLIIMIVLWCYMVYDYWRSKKKSVFKITEDIYLDFLDGEPDKLKKDGK